MATIDNRLDQKLDIAGSQNQESDLVLSEEPLLLGSRIPGQIGSNASIVLSSGIITISGLLNMTDQSVGHFLTLFGCSSSVNNGTFLISAFNTSTSVDVINASGETDLNNGSISWIERNSYSLEDDLNYSRTDRASIKGVDYSDPIPTYTRPNATTTQVPVNLSNIAGKTTDARALVNSRKYESAIPVINQNYIFVSATGEFPYATTINRLGLPIIDGADIGNDNACYCDILDQDSGAALNTSDGYKIFGFSRQGSTGVNGNSFEVQLMSIKDGQTFAEAISYNWENVLPSIVDIIFPFRELFSDMDESALRIMVVHGVSSGGNLPKATDVGQFLYCVDSSNLVFTPERPIIDDDGLLVVSDDDVIVVV